MQIVHKIEIFNFNDTADVGGAVLCENNESFDIDTTEAHKMHN